GVSSGSRPASWLGSPRHRPPCPLPRPRRPLHGDNGRI
ncbi:MAG: hypothetical protein AVDCRST_MAG55-1280, partial [uncultured Rubrobacteraceae bacterium]